MAKPSVKAAPDIDPNTPVFDLTAGNINFESDEDLQSELDKSGGKYFDEPGNFDLVIVGADFHKNRDTGSIWCKGDKSWFNVKLTLRDAGAKEIEHWIQVPTSRLEFGPKKTLTLFKRFQQFLFALGEAVQIANLQKVATKYFSDPSALIGTKVNVDLGYEGAYCAKSADGEGYVIMVRGAPLKDDGVNVVLPDRKSASVYAKGKGIETSFLRVVKFTAVRAKRGLAGDKSSADGWD